jgi:hypothetical protein
MDNFLLLCYRKSSFLCNLTSQQVLINSCEQQKSKQCVVTSVCGWKMGGRKFCLLFLQRTVFNNIYIYIIFFNTRSAKAINLTAADFWFSIFLNPYIVLTQHVLTFHYIVSTIRGVKIFRMWYLWYHRLKTLPSNARRGHFDRCRSCRPMYYFKAVVFAVSVAWEGGNGQVVMT